MSSELGQFLSRYSVDKLLQQGASIESMVIPGRGKVFNLYHPGGLEMKPFLDKEHLPRITRFDTVIISDAFSPLRFESPNGQHPAQDLGGNPDWLQTISSIAADSDSYNLREGKNQRRMYRTAMADAAQSIFEKEPITGDDIIVPVVRCGANIAHAIGIPGISVEVKRLRFDGLQDLLGAGINLPASVARQLSGKRVRLLEGVIATGATESVFMLALENQGVQVRAVDCDAVVIASAGARYTFDFRKVLGVNGRDRGCFVGGRLNQDWYVEYDPKDRLLSYFGGNAENFIDRQVLGDGGDLTSNID